MPHDSTGCERVQIVDICVAGTPADLLRISGGERLAKVRYPSIAVKFRSIGCGLTADITSFRSAASCSNLI
jgi:hypothetical protein